ncbi:MAG: hypothetical protein WAK18_00295 [Nocardioidaceae bacterium]
MRIWFALVLAPLLVLLPLGGTATAAKSGFGGHWHLDEKNGTTAHDATGNGNQGVNHHTVGDGSGYGFNGKNARVIVPSSNSLNPGGSDFSFGVTLKMTKPPSKVGETYDVLRKGLASTKGGDYKLEIKNVKGKAVARCVVKSVRDNGRRVNANIQGLRKRDLADGKAHTLTCTKTASGISLKVDSLKLRSKTYAAGLGTVSNNKDLALGAKAESSAKSGFDWYNGVLNDAWVKAS